MPALYGNFGRGHRGALAAGLVALVAGVLAWPSHAGAYIGDSFLTIPGVEGDWRGADHHGAIRVVANEWPGRIQPINSGATDPLAGDKLYFGGPYGARPGNPGRLTIALRKDNPVLPRLMEMCSARALVPEMTYAESSDRARPVLELGPRPAEFPEFWEYRLREVTITDCPVAEGAPEQALVVSFQDTDWLNYDPARPLANRIVVTARDLPRVRPAEPTARSGVQAYLITWIAPAALSSRDQCPVMNGPPSEAEILRYTSPEEAQRIRQRNGDRGFTFGGQTERRGPHGLSVTNLPGIVPDPGFHEPETSIADGLDLDGNDGTGAPPPGIRQHRNYTSPDGRAGIDNQLFAVFGCVPGFQGKNGYRNQTSNARRADGNVVTLVEVSGIDDPQNDRRVEVAIIYSMDRPVRDNGGRVFIPNYTYRTSDNLNFALYNMRVRGRIVNGVVETDEVPLFEANLGQDPLLRIFNARMRFAPMPDGSVRGLIGGYLDWRRISNVNRSGYSEGLFGFQAPGLYQSLQRNADGLYDPVTGQYNGISVAYEIDTVPAFIAPAPAARITTQNAAGAANAR